MDMLGQASIELLIFLLPGLVAAELVFALTPSPKPTPFERVVHALILTIVVQALVVTTAAGLKLIGKVLDFGEWTDDLKLVWSIIWAGTLGLAVARAKNTDKVHSWLRSRGLTHQTSFSSEWYGAFCQNHGYVVLHLSGQRRLYGWPEEWSSTPTDGHFVMSRAEWLSEKDRIPLLGVERIMVRSADIEMVEFMDVQTLTPETSDGRSQGANTTTTTTNTSGSRSIRAGEQAYIPASSVQAASTTSTSSEEVATATEAT